MTIYQDPGAGLRKWQRSALQVIAEVRGAGRDKAFIAACPGAGKTRLTIAAWSNLTIRGDSDILVIIVPSRALKRQWRKHCKDSGITAMDQIPNEHLERRAYQDEEMFDPERPTQIYTYAQVAVNPDLFRILSNRHRVFVVMDEIHHADDEEKFGEALVHSFSDASFKLMLSGTPFNTKGTKLAFCDTDIVADDDGRPARKTRVDFAYSYGEALGATGTEDDPNVVRPVQFVRWNGTATWERLYLDTNQTVSKTVTGSRKADPLGPLLDMQEGLNLKKMIDAACTRLDEIRELQRNAGMLITAMDRDHCDQIRAYLKSKGIHDVVSVMYDTPNAQTEIDRFDRGNHRILIAIKMISEGVDIKRLRVGVYATNVLTQMFFIQFIGRFIRWDKSLAHTQYSCVYIPEHKQLIKYATEIERMITEAMLSLDGDGTGPEQKPSVLIGINTDGRANGLIEREKHIGRDEAEYLRNIIFRASLSGTISEGTVKKILEAVVQEEPRVGEILSNHEHEAKKETTPSTQNETLVAQCVAISQNVGRPLTYIQVNNMANAHVGIRGKDVLTPEHILIRRREFLKGLLVRIYEKKVDG